MRNLRSTTIGTSCLTAALLLGLGLLVADDAFAQRRKRASERQERRAGEVEEPAAEVETDEAATDEAKSLVSSLEMLVYPADGQSGEQQQVDEAECSAWAEEQVSKMPASSPPSEPSTDTNSRGRRDRRGEGRGGLKGAAVGAVVGEALEDDEPEISRDDFEPGKVGDEVREAESLEQARKELERAVEDDGHSSAAVGAAVGGVVGRRRQSKKNEAAAAKTASEASEAVEEAELESLESALELCLESRGYQVGD